MSTKIVRNWTWSTNWRRNQDVVPTHLRVGGHIDNSHTQLRHISGSDEDARVACKRDLHENILRKCGPRGIQNVISIAFSHKSNNLQLQVGELLYCKNKGQTTCCFKEDCEANTASDKMVKRILNKYSKEKVLRVSLNYMKNTTNFLDKFQRRGYDTCHATKVYDASECAEDCENLKKAKFATECKERGGLFKCCIT